MATNTEGSAEALKGAVEQDHDAKEKADRSRRNPRRQMTPLEKAEDDLNKAATKRSLTMRAMRDYDGRLLALQDRFRRTGEAYTPDRAKQQELADACNKAKDDLAAAHTALARAKDDARSVLA